MTNYSNCSCPFQIRDQASRMNFNYLHNATWDVSFQTAAQSLSLDNMASLAFKRENFELCDHKVFTLGVWDIARAVGLSSS